MWLVINENQGTLQIKEMDGRTREGDFVPLGSKMATFLLRIARNKKFHSRIDYAGWNFWA
jgi:hypothetical protein